MEKNEWEIAWTDYFAVGEAGMDEEHKQFIARVNEVNKAIIEAEDKTTVERLMNRMIMEATRHFAHEQQLLDQWNYPKAKVHAEQHAQILARFTRVMKEIQDADLSYVWAVKALQIKQLLVEHLMHEDMAYRDFAREQRSKAKN